MKNARILSDLFITVVLFSLCISSALAYAAEGDTSSPAAANAAKIAVIAIGFVLLVGGWRLYKVTVSITGLLIGIYIAYFLIPEYFQITGTVQILIMILFGVAGFILALPFQKAVVFFLGGLGGLILTSRPVALLARGSENEDLFILIAAVIGLLLFGILSIYFFKFIITVSTSVIGSFNFMVGIYALFENRKSSSELVRWLDPSDKGFFFFLLIAFMGILVQHGINKVFPEPEEKKEAKKEEDSQE